MRIDPPVGKGRPLITAARIGDLRKNQIPGIDRV